MNPGELRERVDIWADAGGEASLQGQVPAPQLLRSVAAKVEPLSGSKYWRAQQVGSEATHTVTIRWPAGLVMSDANWFMWDGRRLNIEVVANPDARREFLVAVCREAHPEEDAT